MDHLAFQLTHPEAFPFGKQFVELTPIDQKLLFQVEYFPKNFLNLNNMLTNGNATSHLGFDIRGSRQVIRVRMSFQNPVYCQMMITYELNQTLRTIVAGAPGFGIIIEYRVDHGRMAAVMVVHNITERFRVRIQKRLHYRLFHLASP